jgi:hypothetical protein
MYKVMEVLMLFWKTVFKLVKAFTLGTKAPTPKAEEPIEAKTTESVEKAEVKSAESESEEEKPKFLKDGSKLICTISNGSNCFEAQLREIKKKSRGRAIRHFEGKEVKHRVTEKNSDSIEFAFFRSGNPTKVRWQKVDDRTQHTPAA